MSLILEALRKSEAERRRGQLPDLHAELPPVAQPARTAAPAWLWLTLLLVFVTAVATAWLVRGLWAQPPRATATPTSAVRPSPRPAAPAVAAPDRDDAGVAASDAGNVSTPVTAVAEAAIEPPRLASATPQPSRAASPPAVPSPAAVQSVPSPPLRAAPIAAPANDTRAAGATVVAATPPAPAPSPGPAKLTTPAVPANLPAPVTSLPASASAQSGAAAPVRLADLAAAERQELPPLKISMHMWNAAADQRFAIIDGNRIAEGDRVGNAVIEEITRDGVVLAWQGRRLKLAIR